MKRAANQNPPRLGVSAAEAARMVGSSTADSFRNSFAKYIKPLPLESEEIYSVAVIKRVFAALENGAGAPLAADDENWMVREAERRVLED